MAPILIFVALDIMSQAFEACPKRHFPAVAFSFFPIVARLLQIKLSDTTYVSAAHFTELLNKTGRTLPELLVIVALGNGFILTAMLWGAFIAILIDKKLKLASAYLILIAVFTFFGIIHSAIPDGNMYLPWNLSDTLRLIPYQFTAAYVILAAVTFSLSFIKKDKGELTTA